MKLLLAMLPTILLTAYSQLLIKWRVAGLVATAVESGSVAARAARYLVDPYIISAFVASFLSAIAWLYVAERYPVSIAFPTYVGLLFAVVTVGSTLVLRESLSLQQLSGIGLILVGVFVVSRVA